MDALISPSHQYLQGWICGSQSPCGDTCGGPSYIFVKLLVLATNKEAILRDRFSEKDKVAPPAKIIS
jgi:hypothetical protein